MGTSPLSIEEILRTLSKILSFDILQDVRNRYSSEQGGARGRHLLSDDVS